MKKEHSKDRRRPILVFDFETSGLPEEGGQPVEFAAILLDPYTLQPIPENAEFHRFMKLEPGESMHPKAYDTHKYTTRHLDEVGQPRGVVAYFFWVWLESHGFEIPYTFFGNGAVRKVFKSGQVQALGQNIAFDLKFWEKWLGVETLSFLHFKHLDTMPLASLINASYEWAFGFDSMPFRHPDTDFPSVSLISQASFFGLDYKGAHSALVDARLAAEVYRRHVVDLAEDLRLAREAKDARDKKN